MGGLMNVVSDYLYFACLLKNLRKKLKRMEEWLYWWLNGHLQILEIFYRLLCAQGSSKIRAQNNSSDLLWLASNLLMQEQV